MIPDLGPPIESLRIDIENRIYQPIRLLKAGEKVLVGEEYWSELTYKSTKEKELILNYHEVATRAKNLRVNLGEDDCNYILAHKDKIPAGLQGNIKILFTGYEFCMSRYGGVIYIYWNGNEWCEGYARYWMICNPTSIIYALRRIK